ncbi:MAG TPA: adenylate kinase [Tissierellia bacterium]|jgi:adenylate kinase|nr:adenylate kinase [Tissierellia bacterium]
MRLVLLGPPNAGKGTQADKIVKQFDIPHISTGDLLRKHVAEGTLLGQRAQGYMDRGDLVPDDLIIDMVQDTLENIDIEKGFLFDGYPRNPFQAEALDDFLLERDLGLDRVLYLHTDQELLIRRAVGRRTCPVCRTVYNIFSFPPKEEGICDKDGAVLIQRPDDREETVRNRLKVFEEQTAPLVEFYEVAGLLLRLDGSGSPDEVFDIILKELGE